MRKENSNSRPPPWLQTLPRLATLYREWAGHNRNRRIVEISSLVLVIAAVGATWLVRVHRVFVASAFERLKDHTLTIAVLAGMVAAVAVSRQRSIESARAARSWVAAMPMSPRARLIEGLSLALAPIIVGLALILGFGLLTDAALAIAGLPVLGCLIAIGWLFLGALLGGTVGLAVPLPKPVTPYPGSRYVPHRATPGRRPAPSVGSLGIWPIRRMFAMLQPKTVSRTLLPVLLMTPLGTTAAAAMVVIGLVGATLAALFLLHSVVAVIHLARRWLKPLPLSFRRLSLVVAIRSLVVMAGIGAMAKWLMWVGGL
jgi:hypothetical protein